MKARRIEGEKWQVRLGLAEVVTPDLVLKQEADISGTDPETRPWLGLSQDIPIPLALGLLLPRYSSQGERKL